MVSYHYVDSIGFKELYGFMPDNYQRNAEMGLGADYGMIDGIINNGPKEDKPLDAKAPDTGEKSSIMDRLKSAKAEKQKECCPPKKHKGEIEL